LLVSDDLQDILALSDRIAVMYGGRIVGEMTPEDLDLDRLASMMAGTSRAEISA
jgi:general nucleoside transport system ATP-binding protein